MYTALYRSERPEVFSEILGQEHIVKILKNQIATGTVSHAYLFCGTRGTGKTTTARILAKAVNCVDQVAGPCGECDNCKAIKEGTFIDVIEIDAASNNGVENIREINESVKFPPTVGKKKVYIIDEVHMLSAGAFNALLKTLEEPPENVMFILATTEPQKLPATILSRCMRLDFKRVPEKILIEGMQRICSDRGVSITEDGLKLLATNADGSVRDGLSILDQCISTGEKNIDRELILEFLGTVGDEFFIDLTDRVMVQDVSEALLLLDKVISEGKDVKQLMKDWNAHYRNLLITKYVKEPEALLNMSKENLERIREQSQQITLEEIDKAIIVLSRTINEARWSTQARILLEMAMVEIASEQGEVKPVVKTQGKLRQKEMVRTKEEIELQEKPEAKEWPLTKAPTQNLNLDEIWNKVFEKGEKVKPSFNTIKYQTSLVNIDGDKFKVQATSAFCQKYLEDNRALIEDIMKEVAGASRMAVVKGQDDATSNMPKIQSEEEELAQNVSDFLGINVELK